MSKVTMDIDTSRDGLGFRYFAKDGKVYTTEPTGVLDSEGKMTYKDVLQSANRIDAACALAITEYKLVDDAVESEADLASRIVSWMRTLTGNVKKFDGMKHKMFWYNRKTGNTSSRTTMDLEDDAPGTTVAITQDGVPLPLEFADWKSNVRRDPTASLSAGYDVSAEKAAFAAGSVAKGLDQRQLNGWGKLAYNNKAVYGFRDVPTTTTVAQLGETGDLGWMDPEYTTVQIYDDIVNMVRALQLTKVPMPYILMVPEQLKFRLAEPYHTNTVTGAEKSLYLKILESPGNGVPNILGIQEIKLLPEMDELVGGTAATQGEAFVLSLDPKYFRVLDYLTMQSFTMDLKSTISQKHRVVEGVCPLFKTDIRGNYGICKLTLPTSGDGNS